MNNDKSPKYDHVVQMYDMTQEGKNGDPDLPPGAPLLRSLGPSDLKSATSIKIYKEVTSREYGPFNFHISDAANENDTIFLQGQVGFERSATMTRADGSPHIAIKFIPEPATADEELKKFQHFAISRKDESIGEVAIGPEYKTIFVDEQGKKPYSIVVVDSFQPEYTEMVISRTGDSERLVKIHFPERKGYEPFEGSVLFFQKPEEPVTQDEKELILSIVVSFMGYRNGPILSRNEHNVWAGIGYLIAIGIIVGIIVGIVYLFKYLMDNCNRPGYTCGKRRY